MLDSKRVRSDWFYSQNKLVAVEAYTLYAFVFFSEERPRYVEGT